MRQDRALDFILSFCRDRIPGHGEDSYCYSFCDSAGLIGAFDGCGGAGARKHNYYSGHTEAYVASRLCAGAFYDQFRSLFPCSCDTDRLTTEAFAPTVEKRLKEFGPPKDPGALRIKGSGVRTMPSTAAVALIQQSEDGATLVSAIWAGDSRVYVMDSCGLSQLTEDDTTVKDPMLNLYEDGVLQRVLCSDKPVERHCRTIRLDEPFLVFAATDGCFGYMSTPMEFEGLILETLLNADSAADWEARLADAVGSIAGDDCTLCLAAFGYGSYTTLQKSFSARYNYLEKHYLQPVSLIPLEDRAARFELWDSYRVYYLRYIEGGQSS